MKHQASIINVKISIFFLFLLLTAGISQAQPLPFLEGQRNFHTYSLDEGLPQSTVFTIHEDKRGYLWVGTNGGGLSRFDGEEFQTFTVKNGLAGNAVRSILEDSRGWIWVGTDEGISVYDGFSFTTINKEDSLSGSTILSLHEDHNNMIWAGSDDGGLNYIHIVSSDSFIIETLTEENGLGSPAIFDIYQEDNGRIWLATLYGGINILTPDTSVKPLPYRIDILRKGYGLPSNLILTVNGDHEGNIWAGTYDAGVFKIDLSGKNEDKDLIRYDVLSEGSVWDIMIAADSSVWIATGEEGVFRHKNEKFNRYGNAEGLPTDQIASLLQDHEGNIWIGTNGNGLTRFIGTHFSHLTVEDGLPSDNVQAILQDSTGRFFIGTAGGGVAILGTNNNQPEWQYLKKGNDFDVPFITSVARGNEKNAHVWLSTRKDGIIRYDGNKFERFTEDDNLLNNRVNDVLVDKNGIVWSATANGISRFDGTKFLNASMEKLKMSDEGVKSIIEDKEGNIWFAMAGGIGRYEGNGTLRTFDQAEGLKFIDANTLTEGPAGNIWIGTNGGGLFKFNTHTDDSIPVTFITDDQQLGSNRIHALLFYDDSTLIAATDKGMDKILFNENGNIKVVRNYHLSDGFFGVECNNNSIWKDHTGNVWIGTVKGITVYSPEKEPAHIDPPLVHLTGIELFFEDVNWQDKGYDLHKWFNLPHQPELSYKDNHLTFNFSGISYQNPEKVRYQYKLEGWDKDWSPIDESTRIPYSGLTPGDYAFMVRSIDANGNESQPAKYAFAILPPWYQTTWFYITCILLGLLMIFGFIKYRERKLKEEKRILEEKVEERTREVVRKKEEIEQQKEVIEEKNRDIMDSINYASRIQAAILPREEERKQLLKDSFVLFKPKDVVSGDFYWMAERNDKVLFTAADCTGHGVPGAFMSMIGAALFNEAVNEKGITTPGKVLEEVRKGIINALRQSGEEGESKDGMDAALCVWDKKTNTLAYSGANNPLYLIRRDGEFLQDENGNKLEAILSLNGNGKALKTENAAAGTEVSEEVLNLFEVKADKQPIGYHMGDPLPFSTHELKVKKGDKIYLFSDGFPDQFGGPKGKKFMYKRFKKLLLSICDLPADQQVEKLDQAIEKWKEHKDMDGTTFEQIDDILVIGVGI